MTQESLKRVIKFLYTHQWRVWCGLVIFIFSLGLALRTYPGFFRTLPSFSSSYELERKAQSLELLGSVDKPAKLKPATAVILSEPIEPQTPVEPTTLPVPKLPAISSTEPIPSVPTADTSNDNRNEYVVRAGDSLWKLAEEWFGDGYQYVQIARANDIAANTRLDIGHKLIKPTGPQVGEVAWSSEDDGNSEMSTQDRTTTSLSLEKDKPLSMQEAAPYTIQPGDSLWKIAEQKMGDAEGWTEIYLMNKERIGKNPGLIYPRATILVPVIQ